MASNKSFCVYYRDKYYYENFPNKRLSIPKAVYDVIAKFNSWNDILYSTKISQHEIHFKVKHLSDQELIEYVKEFNSKLIGHKHITILEFLTIINHYAYDGAIEIIEDIQDQ